MKATDKATDKAIKNNDIKALYDYMMNSENDVKPKAVIHELYQDIAIYENDDIEVYNIGD